MPQADLEYLLKSALAHLGIAQPLAFKIDLPPRKELGHYATNAAILAARLWKQNPLLAAEQLVQKIKELDQNHLLADIQVAKPGFINFFLADTFLQHALLEILKQDHHWGKSQTSHGEKVLLEFVSANPTGPLHIGHGRWAVVGDIIGRLLEATGAQVEREYYVNNIGQQINLLLASVQAARQGRATPEGGYGGYYIKEIAQLEFHNDQQILDYLIKQQKTTLEQLKVKFSQWFYESELHKSHKVTKAIEQLKQLGRTFEEAGAVWFRSEDYGDDKNRVLVRENKETTYFAADVAYHFDKFQRGFDHLIDIWGADHHGYVQRLQAAMEALDQPTARLEIIIGQLVTLFRGKEPVRMSKRTGEMITLQEVIDEIGSDAVRFFFAATDVNSHLNFDLELAKKQSNDNPVYYVQYAHARISSILNKSSLVHHPSSLDLSRLTHPAERELMLKLLSWPDEVRAAARLRHPHRITEYGKELATVFHHFYEKCRVLGDPARLMLVDASRITLRNVLELLGINAPEKM